MDEAIAHCTRGHRHLGVGEQRRRRRARRRARLRRRRPDARDARGGRRCCASTCPSCKVRVVNVVDLMRLQPTSEHPHGLSDREFDALFTSDRPVIFAYHGYPWLIHRLDLPAREPRQPPRARLQGGGHDHDAVRHGDAQRPRPLPPRRWTSSTACPGSARARPHLRQQMADERLRHRAYTREHGDDMPDVRDWTLAGQASSRARAPCASSSSTPARAA